MTDCSANLLPAVPPATRAARTRLAPSGIAAAVRSLPVTALSSQPLVCIVESTRAFLQHSNSVAAGLQFDGVSCGISLRWDLSQQSRNPSPPPTKSACQVFTEKAGLAAESVVVHYPTAQRGREPRFPALLLIDGSYPEQQQQPCVCAGMDSRFCMLCADVDCQWRRRRHWCLACL